MRKAICTARQKPQGMCRLADKMDAAWCFASTQAAERRCCMRSAAAWMDQGRWEDWSATRKGTSTALLLLVAAMDLEQFSGLAKPGRTLCYTPLWQKKKSSLRQRWCATRRRICMARLLTAGLPMLEQFLNWIRRERSRRCIILTGRMMGTF